MSSNYYFASAALPPLEIGVSPDLAFVDFDYLLRENLNPDDYALVRSMRTYSDIQNLRHFWRDEDLDPHGNYREKDMEEALLTQEGMPDYVYDYMEMYDDVDTRLRYLPKLVATYFRQEIERADGFIEQYLTFEREMRLVFLGFRCKQTGRDLARELQWEDTHDDLVVQLMAQKDAKTYEPPSRYEDLKGLFETHKDRPLELHKALEEYRFQKVTEFCPFEPFSLDWILAYMVQLMIVERWEALDKELGQELVSTVVDKVQVGAGA